MAVAETLNGADAYPPNASAFSGAGANKTATSAIKRMPTRRRMNQIY
jgi:hypothetical protein